MEKAISFLSKINEKDNIITVFHNDADGCCSCALLDRFLESYIGKKSDYIISQPMPPAKNLISRIRMSMPTKIIFLDLGIDQNPSLVKKLESDCEVLIIDHHQIMNNLNSKKTVHFNPMMKKKVYQSASYLTYKICSKITDMSERLWIALVGIVGDYNVTDSMDLLEKAKEVYPDILKSLEQDYLHRSPFGQMANIISAAKASKITCEDIVIALESMKSVEDIDKNEKMMQAYRKVEEEIERVLIDAKSTINTHEPVIFYEIKSAFNIHSPVSTQLSREFPKKVIIVWEKIGNKIKVSARNQSKNIDVGKVLREAIRDIKHASAGGHEAAGGVSIRKDDWDEFVEKLKTLVKNKMS